MKTLTVLFLFVFISFISNSCKDEYEHPVPDVVVDLFINISTHFELQNIGGYMYKTNYGFNGIVVYRYSMDEFTAFDMACPHHPFEYDCVIEVNDPPIAIEECCDSSFNLLDGSVISGPSKHPLKQYRAYFNPNTNYLQISNY